MVSGRTTASVTMIQQIQATSHVIHRIRILTAPFLLPSVTMTAAPSTCRPPFGQPEEQTCFLNYCSSGDGTGRDLMESHARACLYAGLHVSGTNLEVCGDLQAFDGADADRHVRYRHAS